MGFNRPWVAMSKQPRPPLEPPPEVARLPDLCILSEMKVVGVMTPTEIELSCCIEPTARITAICCCTAFLDMPKGSPEARTIFLMRCRGKCTRLVELTIDGHTVTVSARKPSPPASSEPKP